MPTPVAIELRNLRFDLGPNVPRHWLGGRRSVTRFIDSLSTLFPAGEKFFMDAVRVHEKYVKDPELLAQVRLFHGQEAVHSREHVRYNDMVEAQGLPAKMLEKRTWRILKFVRRYVPRRHQLAATCALEHFTAILAHVLLTDPRLLEGADPTMAALWRWHAAEENEHKAVAFDVYEAAGGFLLERALVMVATTAIFWAVVADQQVRYMRADGILFSPREWGRLLWFFLVKPGGLRAILPLYFDYFRPGFHPWDLDNRDLLERWKREYAPAA